MYTSSSVRELVGNVAVMTTILQFLSGILVCRQYVLNQTTAESSPLPFISGVISCFLWLMYGITKQESRIVLVNVIGFTLMAIYTSVFYKYSYKKSSVLKQVGATGIFLVLVIFCMSHIEDNEFVLNGLGMSSSIFTLLTVAAPMSKLLHVLKVKCTECLPFPMILMSFFVSTLWFLYGQLEEDVYLSWVNFIGMVLAVSQLLLFVVFPSKPKSPMLIKHMFA